MQITQLNNQDRKQRSARPWRTVARLLLIGVALIKALRDHTPELKIIASSGLGNDWAEIFDPGNCGPWASMLFLSKPYTAEKLLIALRDALGNGQHLATILGQAPALAA